MPTPTKAKKTPRNRPVTFDESLVAATPPVIRTTVPAVAVRLTSRQLQLGLVLVWAAAAIIGGVGIGRLILAFRATPAPAELPAPVAKASVRAVPAVPAITIAAARPVINPSLAQSTPVSPYQAVVGIPVSTLSAAGLQPAGVSDALQPGFTHFGHPQGNLGTDPVN